MFHALRGLSFLFLSSAAFAQEAAPKVNISIGKSGVSALWILANVSYAGMRAQNNPSKGWRIIAFLLGLPGTLITYFAVREGSERAYGIDTPLKK